MSSIACRAKQFIRLQILLEIAPFARNFIDFIRCEREMDNFAGAEVVI